MAFAPGTDSTSLSKLLPTYYNKVFLTRAEKTMVTDQFAQKKELPKYSGQIVYFSRYLNLGLATTALTDGVLPAGLEISSARVSATVTEYGAWGKISKLVSETSIDPEIEGKVDIFGYQAASTLDRLNLTTFADFTKQVTGAKTNVSQMTNVSDYVITSTEVRKAVRTLKKNYAMPINGYFVAFINPDVAYDLMGDSTWVAAHTYGDQSNLYKGEIGKMHGVRFVESSETYRVSICGVASYTAGLCPATTIIGAEAYGVIPLADNTVSIQIKKPGSQDTSQPIYRYNTVGWQVTRTQLVLNSTFGVNIFSRYTA